ncbi:MAG: DUF2200 domain-containing protein [Oscillospiraceae bacterium]|jgi:hypothetical protein|nr:DUF2200 domain-containing protein [Oscillospiraceae bacterium]
MPSNYRDTSTFTSRPSRNFTRTSCREWTVTFSTVALQSPSSNSLTLQSQLDKEVIHEIFYNEAPRINPNAEKIKGVVCGVQVEDIEDPLMQKIRWLDKLVDELAKGKAMEKILRK